jgi:CMP/dCMP kinase
MCSDDKKIIITIDGPAGSGKSTVARQLAQRLGVRFLDTGAMYRGVALAVVRAGISEGDQEAVATIAADVQIDFKEENLLLNGKDASQDIRTPEVTAVSSIVAAYPAIRSRMVELQRSIGAIGSMVTEGRDQGTIVFPNADHKFFITASLETRSRRRQRELSSNGANLKLSVVREQLRQRDDRDEQRAHAPMKPAKNAIIVDTSEMNIGDVVQYLCTTIERRDTDQLPSGV